MSSLKISFSTAGLVCMCALPIPGQAVETFTDSVTVTGTDTFLQLNGGGSAGQNWKVQAQSDGDFSIRANTAADNIFVIDPGAPADALFISDQGNVGLGTSTPGGSFSARLHIADPSPDIVFDTGAQVWDLFATDTGFGITDETANTLPFSVRAGAPSGALAVAATGFVGVGTGSPQNNFHVQVDDGAYGLPFLVENTNAINFSGFRLQISPTEWIDFNNSGGDFRINADQVPGAEFEVRPNGNAFLAGTLTQGSDVNSKQDIEPIYHEDVLAKVMSLPISEWSYKNNPKIRHIGPMAQDFYQLFSLGDTDKGITSIDTGGVALAAIQGVKREKDLQIAKLIAEKDAEIGALREQIKRLESAQDERMLHLELAVTELLRKQGDEVLVGAID